MDPNTVALVLAIGSFVFTLYQWLVNMNSRRPNIRLVRFQLGNILLNQDYKEFLIQPKMNFIVVNLSDIPNSILDMKCYCYVAGKWHEGRVDGAQNFFPIFVQGHSSATPHEGTISFSFPCFPTVQELHESKLVIELYDQYDKVYKIKIDSKTLMKTHLTQVPYFSEKEEHLASIGTGDSAYYLIHNKADHTLGIYSFARSGHGRGGSYFTPDIVQGKCKDKEDTRIFYSEEGRAKFFFIKENGIPTMLEIEENDGKVQKIALPTEFRLA